MRFIVSLMLLFSFTAKADVPMQAITVILPNTSIQSLAWRELDSAMDADCKSLAVYNSGQAPIYLGIGAAASEVRLKYDFPPASGAVQLVEIAIKKGERLAARAIGGDATTGHFVVNCLQ